MGGKAGVGGDVGADRFDCLPVGEAVEQNIGAACRQRARDAEANAARRAGDDGGFANQHLHRREGGPRFGCAHQHGSSFSVLERQAEAETDPGCRHAPDPMTAEATRKSPLSDARREMPGCYEVDARLLSRQGSIQGGRTMEMHQSRYFLAVAETLSFTRAAEKCNVTQ